MPPLPYHSPHDYRLLTKRWRAMARSAGLVMRRFATEGEQPVYMVRSPALRKRDGIYISAGIHGDEAAATEALVEWAEDNQGELAKLPCLIFPCLNPWGLINNSRLDREGRDLNRVFQHDEISVIHTLKTLIAPYRFALALTLHEDYDAHGLYIYEIERTTPFWGEALLDVARPIIPIEGRTIIDRRRSSAGLVRRKIDLRKFPMLPEAVYLHAHHSERTFTIETPSEFALEQRVQAQKRVIDECIRRCQVL